MKMYFNQRGVIEYNLSKYYYLISEDAVLFQKNISKMPMCSTYTDL